MKKYIPVTENGKQIILVTNAPLDTITAAFHTTHSVNELTQRIASRGYYAIDNLN